MIGGFPEMISRLANWEVKKSLRFFVCAAILAGLSLPAFAQSTPKAEIFGGFSYLNYEVISANLPSGTETLPTSGNPVTSITTVNFTPRMNLFGWNGSVTANLLPWFGFTTDFGGDYSNASRSANSTETITTGLPCVTLCNISETYQLTVSDPRIHTFLFGPQFVMPAGKVKLFTHFLAGGMNRKVTSVETATSNGSPVLGITGIASGTANLFSMAFGGGADFPIQKQLAWRVGVDYLTTTGTGQNHVRVTTGVVWMLGK
jgi:hypothetical protein